MVKQQLKSVFESFMFHIFLIFLIHLLVVTEQSYVKWETSRKKMIIKSCFYVVELSLLIHIIDTAAASNKCSNA